MPPKNNILPTNKMPLLEQRKLVDVNRKKRRKLRTLTTKWFRGTVVYSVLVTISDTTKEINGRFPMNNREDQVQAEIIDDIDRYLGFENYTVDWLYSTITFFRQGDIPAPPTIRSRRMREQQPLNLSINIFNNIIDIESTNNNCVVETLSYLYPKLANQKKNPISSLKEANTDEIMDFCKKYNIRAIAYNIEKQVIAEHIPEKNDKKYKTLAYVYYGNHMYLLHNNYLIEKPDILKTEQQTPEDLEAHFHSLLNQNIIVKNIHFQGTTPTSFEHNNTIYFANPEYQKCFDIAKTFMFSDKIPHYITYSSILKSIEPLYTSKYAESFLPIRHIKPAFYHNNPRDNTREIETIDKNKMYSNILRDLPYLLSTDLRTHECQKTDKYIHEYYLYVAKPRFPNILMPKQDIYSGQHIKYCQGKFQFEIKEALYCKRHSNYYSAIVTDLYSKFPPSTAKDIINRAIGMFQREPSADNTDVILVSREDITPRRERIQLNETMYAEFVPNTKVSSLYNKKPIAIQIKDNANRMLYEKMEELHLKDEDIIQINTDSITFYKKPTNLILNKDDINGWKKGEYNQTITTSIFGNSLPFETFFQTPENNNTLITGYAGNGKSYHIQHMDLTDSIILSSKHSAITQHRNKHLKAEVIQKYCAWTNNQTTRIPDEHHIIIEECGILTKEHWDFLFKCFLLKKKLTVLGDFGQLLPFGELASFDQPAFLNMMFSNQYQKLENWRNNFTFAYYESLKHGTPEYLEQEIKKYSTQKPEDADIIIVYETKTRDKYNSQMLQYHNKTINDPDVPIMAITNDLRNKDIYNNFLFKSQDIPEELRTNEKYFRPAYARTLFNMQGDETKSYYMAPEDIKWFVNPRMAYTLISRLKQ
jgi:hypothetical protein